LLRDYRVRASQAREGRSSARFAVTTAREPRDLRDSRVPVVQAADSRKRNDSSALKSFNVAAMRRSLPQGLVNSIVVIVADVASKKSAEMLCPEYDHVIEAIAADGSDDPLRVWILPRATRCADDFFDTHRLHSSDELLAVYSIAIAEQVTRNFVPRKRLGDLTSRPSCGRVCSDGEVNDLPRFVAQYDEATEEPERYGWNDEKVNRCRLRHVVLQKRLPCLRRRTCAPFHVLGDGRLRDFVPE